MLVEKHDGQHGIVFTKNQLDQDNEYIEFKVNIKIPSSGSSHLFLGLVNKAKYKTEYLSKLNILLLKHPHFGETHLHLIIGMYGAIN